MKKRLLTILCCVAAFANYSNAQLDGSGLAPNFTLTDINGTSHTFYDYLDDDKVVILDFFATWCGPCNNNAVAVEEVYMELGPNGTNEIEMLLLESSSSSNSTDLTKFISDHSVTCPVFDNVTTVASDYKVKYFPTYYVVYPDRTYKQVTGGPSTIAQVMKDAIAKKPVNTSINNVKIIDFKQPTESYCTDSIKPVLRIQNYGSNTLTSVDISSIINGTTVKTFNWTGSLKQYYVEEIELDEIKNTGDGEHTFTFATSSPNTQPDEDLDNDSIDAPFIIISNGYTITVNVTTDDYPKELSWELLKDGKTFASGGDFKLKKTVYSENICVYQDGCYTFKIMDSEGDGNSKELIEVLLGEVQLVKIDDFEGASQSVEFCATIPKAKMTMNPADGTTEVAIDKPLEISFSMSMRLLNDNPITNPAALITFKENDALGADVAFTASIDPAKKVISIIPSDILNTQQNYYLAISADIENKYDQAITATSVTFTTGDIPTTVTSYSPVEASTDIHMDSEILISFDRPIRLINDNTVTDPASSITFKKNDASGADVNFTATLNSTKDTIIINPSNVLEPNQKYYLAIAADFENAFDVVVAASNASFTTKNTTAPALTFSPANEATGVYVNANISINFDMPIRLLNNQAVTDPASFISLKTENANGANVRFTAEINDAKNTITIDPDTDFSVSQVYYVGVAAEVENEFGMPIEATGITFTTASTTGIDDVLENELKVYPNPFSNKLNIQFINDSEKEVKVEIYNQAGSLVKLINNSCEIGEQSIEINTSDLQTGFYFVRLSQNNNHVVKKISLIR